MYLKLKAPLTSVGDVVGGAFAELADNLAEHQQAPVDVAALAQPLTHRTRLGGALRTVRVKNDKI